MRKENLDYDLAGIKHSSRLITIIQTDVSHKNLDALIRHSGIVFFRISERERMMYFSHPLRAIEKMGYVKGDLTTVLLEQSSRLRAKRLRQGDNHHCYFQYEQH